MNLQTPVTAREPGPLDFPDSPLSRALRQPLLVGLFLPIHHGGWSISTLPRSTDWTFDYNARLAKQAEDFGFDLLFGVAQWPPKGGQGPTRGDEGLDSFITTAALASVTDRILLIATLHVLYGPWHPVHLARSGRPSTTSPPGAGGSTSSPATAPMSTSCSAGRGSSTIAATSWPTSSSPSSSASGRPRSRSRMRAPRAGGSRTPGSRPGPATAGRCW